MEITSLKFACLALVSILLYYLIPSKIRLAYLTVLSLAFIGTFNYYLLIYVSFYATVNYLIGRRIAGNTNGKTLYKLGIGFNLTQLIFIRYASFAIDPALRLLNLGFNVSGLEGIILPIGISYYTLQGIGYLINVNMRWEKPEKNYVRFLLYLIFFPKFISGPIERSNKFLPQLRNLGSFASDNIIAGFRLILNGLVRKVVIANQLSLIVTPVYNNVSVSDGSILLLVILLQPLYLYFDFSGYTNIAIGIARSFGLTLHPNFNRPFLSENVTTFWRRFHMSLAFWFNDYVFKQTTFKLRRWKQYASVTAVFITWILFGIWHGAGWNFMVLGLIQAIAINYEFFTKKTRASILKHLSPLTRRWFGRTMTYLFFGLSLVFFFSPNLSVALEYFSNLKNINLSGLATLLNNLLVDKFSFFIAFGIMAIMMLVETIACDREDLFDRSLTLFYSSKIEMRMLRYLLYYFVILLYFFYGGSDMEFVYFQF